MQKLCSNGGHFGNLFSLHLNRVVLYSTSSAFSEAPSLILNYMVKTLGFSKEEAATAWSKVSYKQKTSKKAELVVDFLRKRGLNNAQIKKIASSCPDLLCYNVVRTLEPKINALEKLGIFGSNLVDVVASNPSIIRRGLETRVGPMMNYVKSMVGSEEDFIKVLRRSYWLMSSDVTKVLKPNVELLRAHGLSIEKIRRLLVNRTDLFGGNPEKLQSILLRVEEELGVHRSLPVFADVLLLLVAMKETTLASKKKLFKSLGWSDSDFLTIVRKSPRSLMLSEAALEARVKFFMDELGCEPGHLASRSYVLAYSLEVRILPRYSLLKALVEKKLLGVNPGILQAVCTSEPMFLKQYVLPYKDEVPELCEAYICKTKGMSSMKSC